MLACALGGKSSFLKHGVEERKVSSYRPDSSFAAPDESTNPNVPFYFVKSEAKNDQRSPRQPPSE